MSGIERKCAVCGVWINNLSAKYHVHDVTTPSTPRADADTAGAKTHRALRMARDCMEANGLGADKVPRVFAIIDDAIAATPASSVADAAGASDEQLDKLFFWMCTNYKTEGLHGFKAKARDLFAAGASERADAEDEPDSIFCSSCGLTRADSNLLHSIHSGKRKAVSSKLFDSLQERADAEKLPEFDDPRVQKVYELICDGETLNPPGEHWDGFVSRRIVAALCADAEKGAALTDDEISTVWVQVTGAYASDCPWDIHGFARAILAANGEKKS